MEKPQQSDKFIDLVAQASRIAIRTSRAEEKQALLNAIINLSVDGSPGKDIMSILTRYNDDLTTAHLRMLAFLLDPAEFYRRLGRAAPVLPASLETLFL